MSRLPRPEDQPAEDDPQPKVCSVCRLPYRGDECAVCKAEREHASAVIQERGRRHRQGENGNEHDE